MNAKKRWRKKHRRYVFREGLGSPIWSKMTKFMESEIGKESLQRFHETQSKILEQIRSAPNGEHITFGELGADDFQRHWFKKSIIVDGKR